MDLPSNICIAYTEIKLKLSNQLFDLIKVKKKHNLDSLDMTYYLKNKLMFIIFFNH